MNRKGFTLIELIATIVILSIVMSIGAYSIINIVKSSKEENYNLLIKNIKDAAETYYQECKYGDSGGNNSGIECNVNSDNNVYTTTLGELVNYGYLKGNSQDSEDKYTLVNPKTNENISSCPIDIDATNSNNIRVYPNNYPGMSEDCPYTYLERKVACASNILYGDVTGDGIINGNDVNRLRAFLNGNDVSIDSAAADVNLDGELDNADLVLIRRYNAHTINHFSCDLG